MPRNPQPRRDGRDSRPRRGNSHRNRFQSPPRIPQSSYNDRRQPERDSWRPNGDGPNGHGPRDSRDNYRPPPPPTFGQFAPPQADFTFRMDKPAGVGDFDDRRHDRRPPRGGRDGRGRGKGRGGRPRWKPPMPSERALISGATLNLPEERIENGDAPDKYRNLEEMSDDDELEMDMSSEEEAPGSENDGPSKKRTRVDDADEATDEVPKWSNPDPYTALPCPDETTRKKRDVVKLIRKARVEEEAKAAAPAKPEDFISFDFSDDDKDDDDDEDESEQSESEYEPEPAKEPEAAKSTSNFSRPLPPPSINNAAAASSKKRTIDDEIKPPDYSQMKKATTKPAKGNLLPMWLPKKTEEACPWSVDHTATKNMAFRLHKEIMDFYEFVRPRDFEQKIRTNLVDNLKKAMRRDGRNFGTAQVFPFGSFMSGLYLPTADMDLVVCSASFMRGGPPTYLGAKNWLYKFKSFLVSQRIADSDSIQVIAHARVPLVKFVDKFTGLRVDVSFENLGGVDAVDTFMNWKKQYPAMPILVTVIKHFLLMRGLNEPVNGGIGGFSVICLVVSMLQLMPQVQSKSLIPEHNLGEMLLEFFDLYGHQFNYEVNAISLVKPVGYIRKNDVHGIRYRNTDRLSIIDPNNDSNDISGGSANTTAILTRFSDAYYDLRERMREVALEPSRGAVLDILMRGDYSSFRKQRGFLRQVHEKHLGPCTD